MDFTDKVVLITGASSGIGAETAKHFAQHKAKLGLTGRDATALENNSKTCKSCGSPDVLVVKGDVTDGVFAKSLVSDTIKHFGRLDVLVNSAGILEIGSIKTTNMEQFDRMMNINVCAVYHLTHLAVPHLIKTRIVSNMHRRAGIQGEDYEALLERSKGNHPIGRPGTVDEVAKSILFLASDNSWLLPCRLMEESKLLVLDK